MSDGTFMLWFFGIWIAGGGLLYGLGFDEDVPMAWPVYLLIGIFVGVIFVIAYPFTLAGKLIAKVRP